MKKLISVLAVVAILCSLFTVGASAIATNDSQHPVDTFVATITEPTCMTPGASLGECAKCGMLHVYEVPALGHDWQLVVDEEATDTEKGSAHWVCTRCGETADSIEIEKVAHSNYGHNWDAGRVIQQPTLTRVGYKMYTCQYDGCEEKLYETLGTLIPEYAVAEEYFIDCETVHYKWVLSNAVAGVDTDAALAEAGIEKVIEEDFSIPEELYIHDYGVEAKKDGKDYYVQATNEELIAMNDAGTISIVSITYATCEKDGSVTLQCVNVWDGEQCDEQVTYKIKKTGHNFGEWIQDYAPTEDAQGVWHRVCQNVDLNNNNEKCAFVDEHSGYEAPKDTDKGGKDKPADGGDAQPADDKGEEKPAGEVKIADTTTLTTESKGANKVVVDGAVEGKLYARVTTSYTLKDGSKIAFANIYEVVDGVAQFNNPTTPVGAVVDSIQVAIVNNANAHLVAAYADYLVNNAVIKA